MIFCGSRSSSLSARLRRQVSRRGTGALTTQYVVAAFGRLSHTGRGVAQVHRSGRLDGARGRRLVEIAYNDSL